MSSRKAKSVEDITRTFARLLMQGKMTAVIKLLDRDSSTVLVTPSQEVLEELKKKHPSAAEVQKECLLNGPKDQIPPSIYDLINKIYDAALKTKGSAGLSGMDAELYHRILCSKNFAGEGKPLREEIVVMTRNLLKSCYYPSLLEAYTSCRLVPLDKNPGIQPIGVSEVLQRIIGKTTARSKSQQGGNQVHCRPSTGLRRPQHGSRGCHTYHEPSL